MFLEHALPRAFVQSIGGQSCQNRCETIRDLICDHLIQRRIGRADSDVISVVALVYDPRVHHVTKLLADMQHKADVSVNAILQSICVTITALKPSLLGERDDKLHQLAGKLTASGTKRQTGHDGREA